MILREYPVPLYLGASNISGQEHDFYGENDFAGEIVSGGLQVILFTGILLRFESKERG
jgi:hypothetical protein